MKPLIQKILLGVGGVGLFTVAFIVFATLSGAPRHELPIIGSLFEPPEEVVVEAVEESNEDEIQAPEARSDRTLNEANASALGAFVIPSPFSTDELSELETELENAARQAAARLSRIAERERQLDEEERRLSEQQAQLETFRNQLEGYELELRGREEELTRDQQVAEEREQQSWTEIAKFFESGEPKKLIDKLVQFTPEEAANILRALDAETASGLINALPTDSYRDYLDAYRKGGA